MLRLNVGLSQKIGEANYGCRGASVSLEVELDSGLISQPERLNEQIRRLFGLARTAVEEELNRGGNQEGHDTGAGRDQCPSQNHRANGRRATQSQVRAIHAITRRYPGGTRKGSVEGFIALQHADHRSGSIRPAATSDAIANR